MDYVKKKRALKISVLFFLFTALFFGVLSTESFALPTQLNITMSEVVYQNITYAENFDPNESQKVCNIVGNINITNEGNEDIFDIFLRYVNTDKLQTNITHVPSTKWGNATDTIGGMPVIIFVPHLRPGNYSTFTYNISCNDSNPPVDIITEYTNYEHGFERKVLSGHNWSITQSAFNNLSNEKNVTNLRITLIAQNVTWNDSTFNFTLEFLNATGDYTNVTGNGTNNHNWTWVPNGGLLEWNQSVNITFIMRAPFSVPFTDNYMALLEEIYYEAPYLMSNLTLDEVNASGEIVFDFDKRIIQPSDNLNNHNVTWQIDPYIETDANITFTVNEVTIWITEDQDPLNTTGDTAWGYLGKNFTGPYKVNISTDWGNSTTYYRFNYTDGSSSAYPPPIVWMDPKWIITNADGQIMNYTSTTNGRDLYMKYIYVINGYWLEITKNVTTIEDDRFQIFTYVENIGNGWTPENEYVTVYDYVPNEFLVYNFSDSSYTNISVGSAGQAYYGESFRWNIPWKDGKNSSLGPKNGEDAVNRGNYSWNVSYMVNGTGPYRATQLYIVGLDPLKVDGASSSPIISIISGVKTYTNEIIYIVIVLFLITINVANLVITNKIHSKISSIPPPSKNVPPPAHSYHHHGVHAHSKHHEN
jgi:hypothetical protein